jgi:hypothetical protein
MLEIKKTFWLQAGSTLPNIGEFADPCFSVVFNILCSPFNLSNVKNSIAEISCLRCGFDFRIPAINLFMNITDFSSNVAEEINNLDIFSPEITTNLIISDADIKKDNMLSLSHKKHDIAIKNKLHIAFFFIIIEDYRILRLTLQKIAQLKTMCDLHINNLSSTVQIVLELSPMLITNTNKSFYENTHFEIDNLISELSSHSYFNMEISDIACGLVNIIRQVALYRGITEKFFTLSTKNINFSFSECSCFYNMFCGLTLKCEDCRDKMLKNLPLNLGVFNTSVKTFLDDSGEKSEYRVLVDDWNYIA